MPAAQKPLAEYRRAVAFPPQPGRCALWQHVFPGVIHMGSCQITSPNWYAACEALNRDRLWMRVFWLQHCLLRWYSTLEVITCGGRKKRKSPSSLSFCAFTPTSPHHPPSQSFCSFGGWAPLGLLLSFLLNCKLLHEIMLPAIYNWENKLRRLKNLKEQYYFNKTLPIPFLSTLHEQNFLSNYLYKNKQL